jgi:hypothetical protein
MMEQQQDAAAVVDTVIPTAEEVVSCKRQRTSASVAHEATLPLDNNHETNLESSKSQTDTTAATNTTTTPRNERWIGE